MKETMLPKHDGRALEGTLAVFLKRRIRKDIRA